METIITNYDENMNLLHEVVIIDIEDDYNMDIMKELYNENVEDSYYYSFS